MHQNALRLRKELQFTVDNSWAVVQRRHKRASMVIRLRWRREYIVTFTVKPKKAVLCHGGYVKKVGEVYLVWAKVGEGGREISTCQWLHYPSRTFLSSSSALNSGTTIPSPPPWCPAPCSNRSHLSWLLIFSPGEPQSLAQPHASVSSAHWLWNLLPRTRQASWSLSRRVSGVSHSKRSGPGLFGGDEARGTLRPSAALTALPPSQVYFT